MSARNGEKGWVWEKVWFKAWLETTTNQVQEKKTEESKIISERLLRFRDYVGKYLHHFHLLFEFSFSLRHKHQCSSGFSPYHPLSSFPFPLHKIFRGDTIHTHGFDEDFSCDDFQVCYLEPECLRWAADSFTQLLLRVSRRTHRPSTQVWLRLILPYFQAVQWA